MGVCASRGSHDDALIAVAQQVDSDSLRTVLRAWRADREAGRIIPVSTIGVVCENEGYGE